MSLWILLVLPPLLWLSQSVDVAAVFGHTLDRHIGETVGKTRKGNGDCESESRGQKQVKYTYVCSTVRGGCGQKEEHKSRELTISVLQCASLGNHSDNH